MTMLNQKRPLHFFIMENALHFIGFKNDRIFAAQRVFGKPDFYHRIWDARAKAEIAEGDVAVFADKDETAIPSEFSYNDSEHF